MLLELYNNIYNWFFNEEENTKSKKDKDADADAETKTENTDIDMNELENNNDVFLDEPLFKKTPLSPIQEEYHPSKFYFLALKKDKIEDDWSIHGLWPQNSLDSYPVYCKKVVFDINKLNPILDELKKNWYSTETTDEYFWSHEWEKHGSCMFTKMDEIDYFKKALYLYNYVDSNDIIKNYLEKENPKKCQIPFDSEFNLIKYY